MSRHQTAIITGASAGHSASVILRATLLTTNLGIGRQTAIALSNVGWNVVLTARRLSALLETSELLRDPSACLTVAGDIADEYFVKELFSSTIAKFGEHDGPISSPIDDMPTSAQGAWICCSMQIHFIQYFCLAGS